jgi:putative two-component system response regulator
MVIAGEDCVTDKVLFVDDEPSLLMALKRAFHGKFVIDVASSAADGIEQIEKNGPFAVVVSDFRMPRCDGISFLTQVGKIAPDSIRMILTGNAQLETSIRAINEGNIFRFLTKPCPTEILERALIDGIRQYHLVQTERNFYALKKWNESLGGLVQAFIRLIESKDPYTAGHQIRVSQFSAAIATALGFSDDSIQQIRMTSMIHDIGKIYIPVEFLNKPGRLNPWEWDIVKMHSQIGYDILHPIGFPFPIHETVLQHHERIDGSGYPMGLKESEIRVEAKILAVADVTEAIIHHRPYRPAKPIEEAISDLRDNMGIKYDSRISGVALELLTTGGFRFK